MLRSYACREARAGLGQKGELGSTSRHLLLAARPSLLAGQELISGLAFHEYRDEVTDRAAVVLVMNLAHDRPDAVGWRIGETTAKAIRDLVERMDLVGGRHGPSEHLYSGFAAGIQPDIGRGAERVWRLFLVRLSEA